MKRIVLLTTLMVLCCVGCSVQTNSLDTNTGKENTSYIESTVFNSGAVTDERTESGRRTDTSTFAETISVNEADITQNDTYNATEFGAVTTATVAAESLDTPDNVTKEPVITINSSGSDEESYLTIKEVDTAGTYIMADELAGRILDFLEEKYHDDDFFEVGGYSRYIAEDSVTLDVYSERRPKQRFTACLTRDGEFTDYYIDAYFAQDLLDSYSPMLKDVLGDESLVYVSTHGEGIVERISKTISFSEYINYPANTIGIEIALPPYTEVVDSEDICVKVEDVLTQVAGFPVYVQISLTELYEADSGGGAVIDLHSINIDWARVIGVRGEDGSPKYTWEWL